MLGAPAPAYRCRQEVQRSVVGGDRAWLAPGSAEFSVRGQAMRPELALLPRIAHGAERAVPARPPSWPVPGPAPSASRALHRPELAGRRGPQHRHGPPRALDAAPAPARSDRRDRPARRDPRAGSGERGGSAAAGPPRADPCRRVRGRPASATAIAPRLGRAARSHPGLRPGAGLPVLELGGLRHLTRALEALSRQRLQLVVGTPGVRRPVHHQGAAARAVRCGGSPGGPQDRLQPDRRLREP